MGKLNDINAESSLKIMLAASSGAGKTGALWSLAAAGFNLKIFDADNGTPILSSVLEDNPKARDRIEVNQFINKTRHNGKGFPVPIGAPKAWPDALAAINKWPDGGGIYDWGSDTIVVFDSLTMFGRAALLNAQHIENKTGAKPEIQHYGTAMAQIEGLISTLYSDEVKCHILMMTHIYNERDKQGEFLGAFPASLGKGLNEVIPRYFNNILTIRQSGAGPKAKRYLSTKTTSNMVATKVENLKLKDEYLLAEGIVPKPGMAEFFADCGWEAP